MDPSLIIFLFILGIAVSVIVSMVGLGGGVFFIPIFIIIYLFDADIAVGTSIFCMTLNTLGASFGYYRHGCVNYKLALAYDIFDIPGIIIGVWITTVLPNFVLEIVCGITILIIASLVIFKKSLPPVVVPGEKCDDPQLSPINSDEKTPNNQNSDKDKNNQPRKTNKYNFSFAWTGQNIKWVIISSFLGGLITGMVGLGGGTVDTTTMIIIGVPAQIAAGSSSFAMLLTNLFGLGSHVLLGNVNWSFAIPIGIGTLIGSQIGSKISTKINPKVLRKILGGIAMFTGLNLIFG